MAKCMSDLGADVRIEEIYKTKNHIYNNFITESINDTNIENIIVIYGETVIGNPLNAKYVVRWILGPFATPLIRSTWKPTDLVYYFNSDLKFKENPEKVGNVYKLLNMFHFNPKIQNYNIPRFGTCFTIRKAFKFHKNPHVIHPAGSFEFGSNDQDTLIDIFNKYETFISYDPLNFMSIMAAACGCISVVYKIEGLSKAEWSNTTLYAQYLKDRNQSEIYGIAYGLEEVEYAKRTMHLVREQIMDMIQYSKEKTIIPFLKDCDDFTNMPNTVDANML